jgi:hypothetical protein
LTARAPRFPSIEWIFFVCPAKTERRVGFRSDAYERLLHAGSSLAFEQFMLEALDPERENLRPDLGGLGSDPLTRLATVEECRALARLPNVTLGNHSNAHLPFTLLEREAVRSDVRRSFADFERLFGPCAHFAIPFGTPGLEFLAEHVADIRSSWHGTLWSTERRPYRPEERCAGAVLPRFAPGRTQGARRIAAWIGLVCLLARIRRPADLVPARPSPARYA